MEICYLVWKLRVQLGVGSRRWIEAQRAAMLPTVGSMAVFDDNDTSEVVHPVYSEASCSILQCVLCCRLSCGLLTASM
jgi:hypothetical protein